MYTGKLNLLSGMQAMGHRLSRGLGAAKLTFALGIVVVAVLWLRSPARLVWLLIPLAAFVVLVILHERLLRSLRARARAIEFYERGLCRLSESWAETGESGERFLDSSHPYARDLDLFGEGSLFELLCTARTRAGEETLARWLLKAAPAGEICARQAAIQELKPRVSFREKLWTLGESVRLGVHPEKLAAWGEQKRSIGGRPLVTLLGLLWIAGLICWGALGWGIFALAVSLVNLAWSHRIYARLEESSDAVETAAKDLELLSGVLALLEQESFVSPRLQAAQAALRREGALPSVAIQKLRRRVEYLESRRNPLGRVLDLFTFWSAQVVYETERWQQHFGGEIRGWLNAVGELEALSALSGFAYEQSENIFPEMVEGGVLFEAAGLAHPLLPAAKAVRNDLLLGGGLQLIVLSGPNMAGKSTFIRCLGVTAVLAQCGAPVRARGLRMTPLAVAASICVLDSLKGGISRFYAEIQRIKQIADLAKGDMPVLFLLDELLSGTNSKDRLAGTRLIVENLIADGAVGIVSTHDLALTEIPEAMGAKAQNCHFEDQLVDGRLFFDYSLKPGVVKSSNALELMRVIGLVGNAD
jgi:hypothetical protein